MKVSKTPLPGVALLSPLRHQDHRGEFIKIYSDFLRDHSMCFNIAELYYSVSKKHVVRGMHFQAPPKAYHKVVHCIKGRIHDVALDIRKGSPTYGQTWSSELTGENHAAVYLPPGLAHGFYCLENDSIVIYIVSAAHQPDFDQGIRWNSFNHRWPGNDPIVSTRDSSNYLFAEYNSPFDYE